MADVTPNEADAVPSEPQTSAPEALASPSRDVVCALDPEKLAGIIAARLGAGDKRVRRRKWLLLAVLVVALGATLLILGLKRPAQPETVNFAHAPDPDSFWLRHLSGRGATAVTASLRTFTLSGVSTSSGNGPLTDIAVPMSSSSCRRAISRLHSGTCGRQVPRPEPLDGSITIDWAEPVHVSGSVDAAWWHLTVPQNTTSAEMIGLAPRTPTTFRFACLESSQKVNLVNAGAAAIGVNAACDCPLGVVNRGCDLLTLGVRWAASTSVLLQGLSTMLIDAPTGEATSSSGEATLGTGRSFVGGTAPVRVRVTAADTSRLAFQLTEAPYQATLSTLHAVSAYVGGSGDLISTSLDQLSWLELLLIGTVAGVAASIVTDLTTFSR